MSKPSVPTLHCPFCMAEITESAPFAFCSRCSVVMHDTCVRDNKCPHCSGELINLPGRTLHLVISGSSAKDVESVARSLLAQTQVEYTVGSEARSPTTEQAGAPDDAQYAAWREQLAIHHKNLNRLEIQLAKYGSLNAPLWLLNQIEDEKAEIERLEILSRCNKL